MAQANRKDKDGSLLLGEPTEPGKRYINRELSWLAFNQRVLEEALNTAHPLLERLRFLSISAANLDEFYMVRVAGLHGQMRAGIDQVSDDGRTPTQQLAAINDMAGRIMAEQGRYWNELIGELSVAGISLVIASSPALLKGIAIIGAGYLAWLGLKRLKGDGGLAFDDADKTAAPNTGQALREAALCNLLNPKVILIFLALYPNFIDYQRGNVTEQLIGLSVIMIVINTIWQTPIALAADALRRWMSNPAVLKGVNRASGVILLIMAALMLGQNLW